MPEFVTVTEAAAHVDVDARTIRRYKINFYRFPGRAVRYVRLEDVVQERKRRNAEEKKSWARYIATR